MGRQPWAVFGLLKTSDAGSPSVSTAEVVITLVGLHAALRRAGGDRRAHLPAVRAQGAREEGTAEEPGQELALAY